MVDFQPKIVAFLCNWCAYAGADLAGVSRMQYPSSLRTVRVMCSGRVDPAFVITALKTGADGVLVAGWHFGDCHYLEGNIQAEKKIQLTQHLLDIAGIGADRLHLAWLSSAEAKRFADIATAVTASITAQGPLDTQSLSLQLAAAEATVNGEMIRWLVGKEVKITKSHDVYGRKWELSRFELVLLEALKREYHKNLIYLAIKQGNTSVRAVSACTGLELKRISYLLTDLEKTSMVEFRGMEDKKPVFAAL